MSFIGMVAFVLSGHLQVHLEQRPREAIAVGGRWKDMRSGLGLPPLSDSVFIPAKAFAESERGRTGTLYQARLRGRFSPRKQRRHADGPEGRSEEDKDPGQQLYLAADAGDEEVVSLEELAATFRALALQEKALNSNSRLRRHRRSTFHA